MAVPLLWPRGAADQNLISSGILYLFGLWFLLILATLALSYVLKFDDETEVEPDGGRPDVAAPDARPKDLGPPG